MITATELKARILSKAAYDGGFRARLIADPKAAIADEIGEHLPEAFEVVVHEDSDMTLHLTLPISPELTEAELEKVADGQYPFGHPIGAPGEVH